MDTDRRLQSLLHDSELLLLGHTPPSQPVFKPPTKLRKILKAKNEHFPQQELRPTGSMLLNINFPELEKTVEATKAILKFEPSFASTDVSYFSYFPVSHELSLPKTEAPGLEQQSRARLYLDYVQKRAAVEISGELGRAQQFGRKSVTLSLLRSWDARIDRVIEATVSNRENLPFDPQQVSLSTPFVTRKMEKAFDRYRLIYLNHVVNYVQMSRAFERPRTKKHPQALNGSLNASNTRILPGESYQKEGRARPFHFGEGHANRSRAQIDSLSLGESISDERRAPGFSKFGYSLLFRPEKAKLMFGLLDELSMVSPNSQESSLFLIFKELVKGLGLGPKDSSAGKKSIVMAHVNELLAQSCQILQLEFFEHCKRVAKRKKIEVGSLSGRQPELLQIIYGYLEDFVLDEGFSLENILVRDEQGLPVWALLYLALRAGLTSEFTSFCEDYKGSLLSEVGWLLEIYLERKGGEERRSAEVTRKYEDESVSFGLREPSDVFKRTLASLLGGADDLADSALLSDMKDFLWFSLFRSEEHHKQSPHYRLLDLQKKIALSESDFLESGEAVELAKVQILSLMFAEALDTLHKNPATFAEAAQLAFLFEESRVLRLQQIYRRKEGRRTSEEPRNIAEDILMEFSNEIAKRFPVEAVAYLCAVESSAKKAALLKLFLEKNGLVSIFFNVTSDSFFLLEKMRNVVGKEAFDLLLSSLSKRSELDSEPNYLCFIRILEESGNISAILLQLIEQAYSAVQLLRQDKQQSLVLNEGSVYLERLFTQNCNKASYVNGENYNEVLLARNVKGLFSLYYERKNPKACLEAISAYKFFEIDFKALSNKLKVLYLELILLCLKIYSDFRDSLKFRSISFDSSMKFLRGMVGQIESYYYEQVAGVFVQPEKPFANYDAMTQNIRDFINKLNAEF